MRITNNTLVGNMLRHLQSNMQKLDNLNQKMASGKKFQKPSEAPIKVANSMQFDSLINNNEQYKRNVDQAQNWLTSSENAIKDTNTVLQRVRELAVYGASENLTQADKDSIAAEVGQLRDELINIANSKLGDRFLFSGQATSTPAFDDDGNYQGDYNVIEREVNPSISIKINVNGEYAFKEAIETVDSLYNNLKGGQAQISSFKKINTNAKYSTGSISNSDFIGINDGILRFNINVNGSNHNVDIMAMSDGSGEWDQDADDSGNKLAGLLQEKIINTTNETVFVNFTDNQLQFRTLKNGSDANIQIDSVIDDQGGANNDITTLFIDGENVVGGTGLGSVDGTGYGVLKMAIDDNEFTVSLESNSSLDEVISKINQAANNALNTNNITYAKNDDGKIKINSNTYGDASNVKIVSDFLADGVTPANGSLMQNLGLTKSELDTAGVSDQGGSSSETISDEDIEKIQQAISKNSSIRAEIGAKTNRLELTKSRLEDEVLNLTRLLSQNEDIDIAETITDVKMQESVYRAALSVSARIMQPTLVDFIK